MITPLMIMSNEKVHHFVVNVKETGANLRYYMTQKGNRTWWSERIFYTPNTIKGWQIGKHVPQIEVLQTIAVICDITILDLLVFE